MVEIDLGRSSIHEDEIGYRPKFDPMGAFVALFILGCIITGFYTMVIYAISTVTGWQSIVCGS